MDQQLAFIFPGQGSQSVGMLAELASEHASIIDTFAQASAVLGYDLWKLCQENTEGKLDQTQYTQPALLTAAVAIWRVWCAQTARRPRLLAGHSLGEYTALVCGGAIHFTDGVQLVAKRGEFMQAAIGSNAGAMAAIIGLDEASIAKVCREAAQSEVLSPANFNSPEQVVIAGHKRAVERGCELAKQEGTKKAIMLSVSVPSHCELMRPAAERLQPFIDALVICRPTIPVIHNVDLNCHTDPDHIREALIKQLISPVYWSKTIQSMHQQGITEIIECGPGRVLWGLTRRIEKSIINQTIYDQPTLTAALTEGN